MPTPTKPLRWVASSKKDLMALPEAVQDTFVGPSWAEHPDAKPLKGFGGAGVVEVVEDSRAMRTVLLYRALC